VDVQLGQFKVVQWFLIFPTPGPLFQKILVGRPLICAT